MSAAASVVAWLGWLLRCLTAAWTATAVAYLWPIGTVPEPKLSFVAALVVAVAMASFAVTGRGPLPAPYPSTAPGELALNPVAAPPQPPLPRSSSPSLPPADDRVPGTAVLEAPLGALDLSAYARHPRALYQCPRCGSFDVATSGAGAVRAHGCGTCDRAWETGVGRPLPDVTIRSWLHA